MSGQTRTPGKAPLAGCTKYASHAPSGVAIVTSESVVLGVGVDDGELAADGDGAVAATGGFALEAGADAADLQAGTSAIPAPSERAPKVRRERRSWRMRCATMSSKESSSHMNASRRVPRLVNKGAYDPETDAPGTPSSA